MRRRSDQEREELRRRLQFCAERLGSVSALAKKTGLQFKTIDYNRATDLTAAIATLIAQAAEVNRAWLLFGDGPRDINGRLFLLDPSVYLPVPEMLPRGELSEPFAYFSIAKLKNSYPDIALDRLAAFRVIQHTGCKFLFGEWLIVDRVTEATHHSSSYCVQHEGGIDVREIVFRSDGSVLMTELGNELLPSPPRRFNSVSEFRSLVKIRARVLIDAKWEAFVVPFRHAATPQALNAG